MKLLRKYFPGINYALHKRIINFQSRLILNKQKRHNWKNLKRQNLTTNLIKNSSWGVSYSVFDGEELLEDSIKSIRNDVDYINVVYQRHSWHGTPANPNLVNLLQSLKKRGLIDEIIEYIPNYKLKPTKQEQIKRNLGLKHALKNGVNYFMCMDVDEFYISTQIRAAKDFILENRITHSFCPFVAYESPTLRSLDPGTSYVQFFSHIGPLSKLKRNKHNVALVDPTRQLNHTPMAKYYVIPKLEMHHMTGYRKNIMQKLKNSSFSAVNNIKAESYTKALFSNTIKVKDIFNITDL